jgi:hypothetical protein
MDLVKFPVPFSSHFLVQYLPHQKRGAQFLPYKLCQIIGVLILGIKVSLFIAGLRVRLVLIISDGLTDGHGLADGLADGGCHCQMSQPTVNLDLIP